MQKTKQSTEWRANALRELELAAESFKSAFTELHKGDRAAIAQFVGLDPNAMKARLQLWLKGIHEVQRQARRLMRGNSKNGKRAG